jgi:hypothetical protein
VAGQTAEVYSGLGMSLSLTNSSLYSTKWDDVTWSAEVGLLDVLVGKLLAGDATIVGGDAGGSVFSSVNGDGVGSAVWIGIIDYHWRKFELVGECSWDWSAKVSGGVVNHECGFGGS